MVARYVVFSHGKDSGPWGRKITALAEVARAENFTVHSVDYRGLDDPDQRVTKLVETCRELQGDLVLVGSSLGAWVAATAAPALHSRGLFLMAPAVYVPALKPPRTGSIDCRMTIVHGWDDEVIPVEDAIRFAREYRAPLHLLNDDHALGHSIRRLERLFEYFLVTIDLPADGP